MYPENPQVKDVFNNPEFLTRLNIAATVGCDFGVLHETKLTGIPLNTHIPAPNIDLPSTISRLYEFSQTYTLPKPNARHTEPQTEAQQQLTLTLTLFKLFPYIFPQGRMTNTSGAAIAEVLHYLRTLQPNFIGTHYQVENALMDAYRLHEHQHAIGNYDVPNADVESLWQNVCGNARIRYASSPEVREHLHFSTQFLATAITHNGGSLNPNIQLHQKVSASIAKTEALYNKAVEEREALRERISSQLMPKLKESQAASTLQHYLQLRNKNESVLRFRELEINPVVRRFEELRNHSEAVMDFLERASTPPTPEKPMAGKRKHTEAPSRPPSPKAASIVSNDLPIMIGRPSTPTTPKEVTTDSSDVAEYNKLLSSETIAEYRALQHDENVKKYLSLRNGEAVNQYKSLYTYCESVNKHLKSLDAQIDRFEGVIAKDQEWLESIKDALAAQRRLNISGNPVPERDPSTIYGIYEGFRAKTPIDPMVDFKRQFEIRTQLTFSELESVEAGMAEMQAPAGVDLATQYDASTDSKHVEAQAFEKEGFRPPKKAKLGAASN